MKPLLVAFHFILVSMTFAVVAEDKPAPALTRPGLSGWCYSFEPQLVAKIEAINSEKRENGYKFTSLFPYAGSLDFDPAKHTAKLYYKADGAQAKYAAALPKDVQILPIIDARADKGEFNGWSDEQYQAVAQSIAQTLAAEKIQGVQVDIEPFNKSHLPFYKSLKDALNAQGKTLTLFVGLLSEPVMTQVFNSCDIVILSGYDSSGENPGPEKFKQTLIRNVARLQQLAEKTKGHYMVGIPASAAWGEYEYKVDKEGTNRHETGHKQEAYVAAALEVLNAYKGKSEFLGLALWKLGPITEKDEPEKVQKPTHMPNYVRPNVWKLIEEF